MPKTSPKDLDGNVSNSPTIEEKRVTNSSIVLYDQFKEEFERRFSGKKPTAEIWMKYICNHVTYHNYVDQFQAEHQRAPTKKEWHDYMWEHLDEKTRKMRLRGPLFRRRENGVDRRILIPVVGMGVTALAILCAYEIRDNPTIDALVNQPAEAAQQKQPLSVEPDKTIYIAAVPTPDRPIPTTATAVADASASLLAPIKNTGEVLYYERVGEKARTLQSIYDEFTELGYDGNPREFLDELFTPHLSSISFSPVTNPEERTIDSFEVKGDKVIKIILEMPLPVGSCLKKPAQLVTEEQPKEKYCFPVDDAERKWAQLGYNRLRHVIFGTAVYNRWKYCDLYAEEKGLCSLEEWFKLPENTQFFLQAQAYDQVISLSALQNKTSSQ